MKTIKYILISCLLTIGYTISITAQNLDQLPPQQRDSILIEIAKEAVLKYGPGYYREYKQPIIKKDIIDKEGYPEGQNIGRVCYHVTFLYDLSKETLSLDYSAMVSIWNDTKDVFIITFGNGYGYGYEAFNKPGLKSSGTLPDLPEVPYRKAPEHKPIEY